MLKKCMYMYIIVISKVNDNLSVGVFGRLRIPASYANCEQTQPFRLVAAGAIRVIWSPGISGHFTNLLHTKEARVLP